MGKMCYLFQCNPLRNFNYVSLNEENVHQISSGSMVQKHGSDLKDFPDLLMHMQQLLPDMQSFITI